MPFLPGPHPEGFWSVGARAALLSAQAGLVAERARSGEGCGAGLTRDSPQESGVWSWATPTSLEGGGHSPRRPPRLTEALSGLPTTLPPLLPINMRHGQQRAGLASALLPPGCLPLVTSSHVRPAQPALASPSSLPSLQAASTPAPLTVPLSTTSECHHFLSSLPFGPPVSFLHHPPLGTFSNPHPMPIAALLTSHQPFRIRPLWTSLMGSPPAPHLPCACTSQAQGRRYSNPPRSDLQASVHWVSTASSYN